MKYTWIPIALLAALTGCATTKTSEVANSAGYPRDARSVELGPYTVHYGSDGAKDFLLVQQGDEILYSKKGQAITVFVAGRSFLDYAYSGKNSMIAAYMIHIRDAKGQDAYTVLDENVDGTFDRKIDYGSKTVYEWKDGKWSPLK
jgi:hypothetical protein